MEEASSSSTSSQWDFSQNSLSQSIQSPSQIDQASFREAIMNFQSYVGLDQTGIMRCYNKIYSMINARIWK